MQLKTVLESGPRVWMPPYGHLTIYSSPRVTLVHLAANKILLGLQVTGKEVSPELICLGNCLAVLLLDFLKNLLGLLDLQFVGLHVIIGQDGFLGPSSFQEILESPGQLHNSLSKLPTLYIEPLLLDDL
jgi:hypothetical protein